MTYIPSALAQRADDKALAATKSIADDLASKLATPGTGLALPTNGMKDGIVRSLKGAREEITGGINTKLTNPLFSTGAKDELALIDVYGKKNNDTINTFVDTLKGILTGPLESFREQGLGGILGNIGSFQNVLTAVTGGFNLDPAGMASRVLGCMGSSSVVNQMSGALQSACTLGGKISPEMASTVYTVVNSIVQTSKTSNVRDAQDLYSIVNQITSDTRMDGLIDSGAQMALYTGVIDQAIQLNVPGALDTMVERSRNDEVLRVALQANAVNAVVSGDLVTVNKFLDELGSGQVIREIPNAVPTLTENFQCRTPVPEEDLPAAWDDLETTLERFDPNWSSLDRDGEEVINLEAFTRASPDARRLMSQDPSFATAIMIADKYPAVDLMKDIKKKYPLAAA